MTTRDIIAVHRDCVTSTPDAKLISVAQRHTATKQRTSALTTWSACTCEPSVHHATCNTIQQQWPSVRPGPAAHERNVWMYSLASVVGWHWMVDDRPTWPSCVDAAGVCSPALSAVPKDSSRRHSLAC